MPDHELLHVTEQGLAFGTGNRPTPARFLAEMPAYSDVNANAMLSEADVVTWLDSVGGVWLDRPDCIRRKNQGQYGACDGHAAATGIEGLRYVEGMDDVPISAWDVYARMCNGIDRGASIGETLPEIAANGAAPESLVPYGTINPRRIPAPAVAARAGYKVVGELITTYEEFLTAYARQEPTNLAVWAGGKFTSLDGEGVPLSFSQNGGACNHAQCGMFGLKKSKRYKGLLGHVFNSWGTEVQDQGCYWLPLREAMQYRYFEAYRLKLVRARPDDRTRPPAPVMV